MTCSRNFRRVLQAGCLGLIGALTVVGCGGSESKPTPDANPGTGGIDGGPGTKANLTASLTTVPLGSVDVGKTSTPATVKITNNGTAAASTVTVTPSGVGVSASGCGGSLAIAASCDVTITATPTAAGAIVGSVLVAAANGNAVNISVTGTAVQPGSFTVAPNAVPLGDVVVGATVPVSVTVTATAAITGLTVGVQGTDLTLGTSATPCTGTLAAGASCTVAATFTSATAGSPTNDAIVVSQGGVSKTVPVTASVLPPAKLGATPTSAALTAAPGSSSVNLDVNVGNSGGMTTGAIAVVLGGANAADFKIVSDKCSIVTLAPGAFCTVTVAYTPAATVTAVEAGTLTITDKGSAASSAVVTLTGTPNISGLTVTGGPALGSVAPGATGAEVVFTVTNTAATPTGALTPAVGSPLVAISSNTCATKATLNKGDTCTIGLKLAPPAGTAAQAISSLLTVSSAAAGQASASFTGNVVTGPALSAAPASVNFGSIPVNQSSTAQTVTITNTGATVTGTLVVTSVGAAASQVAVTGSTCTGTLAPNANCTFAVQYNPTAAGDLNASITVSDGSASASVALVGTGLQPSPLTVSPTNLDFGNVVLGYANATQALVVGLVTGATTDSGVLSTAFSGDAKGDFTIGTADTCTGKTIQPGQTCTIPVTFTASALGTRTAALKISGANGGSYSISLTGKAWPLVQLLAYDATPTAATPATGLDFGMSPNGAAGQKHKYRVVVRGATDPTAASTISQIVLAAGTPADFVYADTTPNPCNGATLTGLVPGGTGRTAPSIWKDNVSTPTTPSSSATTDDYFTNGFWICDFQVQFNPQSGKSATAKTATVTASGSAGGSDHLTLTGIASGPLTFDVTSYTFQTPVAIGTNLAANLSADSKTFLITNQGQVSQGPLTVSLSSTGGDFAIIDDTCSTATKATGGQCTVTVGFAPTAAGTRTATLTVASPSTSESSSVTITGTGAQPAPITISPTATSPATVTITSTPQDSLGAWVTFTVTNPTGGATTGKLTYGLSGTDAGQFQIADLTKITSYPAGACGDTGKMTLTAGQTCTIQVRLAPNNTTSTAAAKHATLTVADPLGATLTVPLSGTATPQIVLSGSDVALNSSGASSIAFGTVSAASGAATKHVTITNNGTAISLTTISPLPAGFSFAADGLTTCTVNASGVLSLAANAPCVLGLTLTGSSASVGTVASTTHVTFGAAAKVISTDLFFTGTVASAPALQLYGLGDYVSTTPIELGNASVGVSTGILTLTFKNVGGVTATALQSSFTGSADFVVAAENKGSCLTVGSLDATKTCTVNLRAVPSTAASISATFKLFGQDTAEVPVNLHATGVTTSNSVYVVPATGTDSLFSFGSTSPFTSSTPPAANTASFTLFNHGSSAVALVVGKPDATNVWVPDSAGDFSVTAPTDATGCGASVAAHTSCVFTVVFNPLRVTNGTSVMFRYATVGYGTTAVTPVLGLFGQVKQPAKLQLSAATTGSVTVSGTTPAFTADFGQILSGQTPSLTFTITNAGELAAVGQVGLLFGNSSGAAYAGTGTYAMIGTSTCPANLPAGGTCTVVVNSQLTSLIGNQPNDIYVWANDASAATEMSVENYKLTASVVNPAVLTVAAPSSTAFTSTAIGGTAAGELTLTVRNGGTTDTNANRQATSALSVALSDSTNFAVDATASTCDTANGYYILGAPAGSSTALTAENCTIVIKFNPTTAGALSTSVSISATTGGSPTAVALTGTGLSDLAVDLAGTTASPIAFSTNTVKTFTISYVGATSTGQLRSALSGANAAAFAIVNDTCFGSVISTGTCTVEVEFTGTASTTAQLATLTVTDGTTSNTVSTVMSKP